MSTAQARRTTLRRRVDGAMIYHLRKAAGIDLAARPGALALLDAADSAFLVVREAESVPAPAPLLRPSPGMESWPRSLRQLREQTRLTVQDAAQLLDAAVIAISPSLSDLDQQALRQAAEQAGFQVVELLAAP